MFAELLTSLRTEFPEISVFSQMPSSAWDAPRLLVRRIPGSSVRQSRDNPLLRTQVKGYTLSLWTKDDGQGADLIDEIERHLWSLIGSKLGDFAISDVSTDGAQYIPDPVTPEDYRHRYVLTSAFTGRAG